MPYAGPIQNALKQIGIDAVGVEDHTQNEPVKIIVGSKP